MRGSCENCGERTYDGICSNCHEELDILVNQADDLDDVRLSDEFLEKCRDQAVEITANNAKAKKASPFQRERRSA